MKSNRIVTGNVYNKDNKTKTQKQKTDEAQKPDLKIKENQI